VSVINEHTRARARQPASQPVSQTFGVIYFALSADGAENHAA